MAWLSMLGNSDNILRRTVDNLSLDTRPVKALDARTRTLRLFWVEHLLMNGMYKEGSRSSPVSLAIVEGLSLDNRINTGHKLGCTESSRLHPDCPDGPSPSNSVAAFSSLNRNGCNEGYLHGKINFHLMVTHANVIQFWFIQQEL